MPDYSIFGGCLRSDIPFHDLRPLADVPPRWTLRVSSDLDFDDGKILGEITSAQCVIRLGKNNGGFRLSHSCTGDYIISHDGSRIACAPRSTVDSDLLCYDIANRVMAVSLHASGAVCLHGSAVRIGKSVITFLAPKGYGKSTLASALLTAGAQLVTDDILAVNLFPRVSVLPGTASLRLWDDSAERTLHSRTPGRRSIDGKRVVNAFGDSRVMSSEAPLSAIYVLAPCRATSNETAAVRTILPTPLAAMTIVTHNKIAQLLGGSEAAVIFERAVVIARTIPVYQLNVARDLHQLNKVVELLMEWHFADECAVA
jgi:hypothetical protein